jgi:hypothetical protein
MIEDKKKSNYGLLNSHLENMVSISKKKDEKWLSDIVQKEYGLVGGSFDPSLDQEPEIPLNDTALYVQTRVGHKIHCHRCNTEFVTYSTRPYVSCSYCKTSCKVCTNIMGKIATYNKIHNTNGAQLTNE